MNIVITAGGTSEYIDKVRKITNSGTGKLGSMIAYELEKRVDIDNIYYICSTNAIKPISDKIHIIEVVNTNDVKIAVEKVLTDYHIDWFIHSMAISDYYVDYVSTASLLETELSISSNLKQTLLNANNRLDNSDKLSSSEDNLILVLKQTPKIIGLIKKISPTTKLIGFKLLENVSKEHLIEVATNLMIKNNCDYVLANDLKDIKMGEHKAILLNKEEQISLNSKADITQKIVSII